MFPTPRNQIRVQLDDTSTNRPISCKTPNQIAQVKILRRPTQPNRDQHADQKTFLSLNSNGHFDNNKPNNHHTVESNDSNFGPFSTQVMAGSSSTTTSQQPMKWSVVVASSNRSSINNNIKTNTVINQQLSSLSKGTSTTNSQKHPQIQTSANAPAPVPVPIRNSIDDATMDNVDFTHINNHNNFDNNLATVASHNRTPQSVQYKISAPQNNRIEFKKKTYQERADEYAKARLRILGSAFPDNDDDGLLSNPVDEANINRLL